MPLENQNFNDRLINEQHFVLSELTVHYSRQGDSPELALIFSIYLAL